MAQIVRPIRSLNRELTTVALGANVAHAHKLQAATQAVDSARDGVGSFKGGTFGGSILSPGFPA